MVIGRGRKGARLCDFLALFRSSYSYVGWRLYLVCRSAYALFPAWEKERISGPMRLGDKRINRFSKVRRS